MSKLIRRKKEIGAALAVALQLIALSLIGVIGNFVAGSHESTKAPTASHVTAPAQQVASNTGALQNQAPTLQPLTAANKANLRSSAHFARKLYEPLAAQVFSLATTRAESAEAARKAVQQPGQRSSQEGGELPNDGPTLTTDREDYQPYTYVYFTGTGFQPGETVNMIVVELDPIQQSFQPWDVVADENGNFQK